MCSNEDPTQPKTKFKNKKKIFFWFSFLLTIVSMCWGGNLFAYGLSDAMFPWRGREAITLQIQLCCQLLIPRSRVCLLVQLPLLGNGVRILLGHGVLRVSSFSPWFQGQWLFEFSVLSFPSLSLHNSSDQWCWVMWVQLPLLLWFAIHIFILMAGYVHPEKFISISISLLDGILTSTHLHFNRKLLVLCLGKTITFGGFPFHICHDWTNDIKEFYLFHFILKVLNKATGTSSG